MSDVLLPPNATPAERALEQSMSALANLPASVIRWMQSPQLIPADVLPWLAWAFSVDAWDETWTEDQKRASIVASYNIHRHKGTIGAVRSALAALGFQTTIVEWFQEDPPEDPYTFRIAVDIDQAGADQPSLAKIIDLVNASKNLRSHLRTVNIGVNSSSNYYCAAACGMGHAINIASE